MRAGIVSRVGPVVLASGLVAACGGASGGGDLGLPNGPGADATVDVAGGDSMVSSPGDEASPRDDASEVDVGAPPPEDAGGRTPGDAGTVDAAGDGGGGGDASPVDSGGTGPDDGSALDAASDASKDKGPFPCGPSLTCDSKTQYCSHAATATIIVVDSGSTYSCQPLPTCDTSDICSCLTTTSPVDTCTCTDEGGGITRTCSCRVCATP